MAILRVMLHTITADDPIVTVNVGFIVTDVTYVADIKIIT